MSRWTTGAPHVAGIDGGRQSNVYLLGRSVYTTYLFPFEITAALLVIAVVGAVVLARRPPGVVRRRRPRTTAPAPSRSPAGDGGPARAPTPTTPTTPTSDGQPAAGADRTTGSAGEPEEARS